MFLQIHLRNNRRLKSRRFFLSALLMLVFFSPAHAAVKKRLMASDGNPLADVFVFYSYTRQAFVVAPHPVEIWTSQYITKTDTDGRLRIPHKWFYKPSIIMVYSSKLHAYTGNILPEQEKSVILKDLSDDPDGWYYTLLNLEGKLRSLTEENYPPAFRAHRSQNLTPFVMAMADDIRQFRAHYSGLLESSYDWKEKSNHLKELEERVDNFLKIPAQSKR